jgi:NTP pyrophosphatase (non-canonical NTP hydrolase)
MPSIKPDATITQLQSFIKDVYGVHNDRNFSTWEMISNVERFVMRAMKGVRKGDTDKIRYNLLISLGWFASLTNRMHIDLNDAVWKRFPHLCSYCASCPCSCKDVKDDMRENVPIDESKRPLTLSDFQKMFEHVYPSGERTLNHAGVHLAEEIGEFSESLLMYRGEHKNGHFEDVILEAADFFSHYFTMFNSMKMNLAEELSKMFSDNCHVCKKASCECEFSSIMKFKS